MKSAFLRFWEKCGPEVVVVLAVLLYFGASLSFDFLRAWDDNTYVASNEHLDFTVANLTEYLKHGMLKLWTPLTMISLMTDHWIWGRDSAFGYHLTNILLQAAAALMFLRILTHLGLSRSFALIFALLWAVHPQRIESVAWIAERKDVLSGAFALASVLAFMSAFDRKKLPWLAAVLYVLAIMSKPSAVAVPLVWAVYLAWKRPELLNWKYIAAFLLLAAAGCGSIMLIMKFFPDFLPPMQAWLCGTHNVMFYLAASVFPWALNPIYPMIEFIPMWVIVFSLGTLAVLWFTVSAAGFTRKQAIPAFAVFLLLYLVFMAPASGVFRFNPTDYADRYSYLPSLAVWAGLAFFSWKVLNAAPRMKNYFALWLVLSGLFFTWTFANYLPVWRNSNTLMSKAVFDYDFPNEKAVVHYATLGMLQDDPQMIQVSVDCFARKLEYLLNSNIRNVDTNRLRDTARLFDFVCCMLENRKDDVYRAFYVLYNSPELNLIDPAPYLEYVKYKGLEYFSRTEHQEYLESYLKWALHIGVANGKEHDMDWSMGGLYKFLQKDYATAIAYWKEYLKLHPDDLETISNIQRAETLLKEKNR